MLIHEKAMQWDFLGLWMDGGWRLFSSPSQIGFALFLLTHDPPIQEHKRYFMGSHCWLYKLSFGELGMEEVRGFQRQSYLIALFIRLLKIWRSSIFAIDQVQFWCPFGSFYTWMRLLIIQKKNVIIKIQITTNFKILCFSFFFFHPYMWNKNRRKGKSIQDSVAIPFCLWWTKALEEELAVELAPQQRLQLRQLRNRKFYSREWKPI